MSDLTTHLALPYLAAAQAQKHVTHNEALRMLDALVQLVVVDSTLTAPPGSPVEGARYIVAASATGAWSGHDDAVAAWLDGAWQFFTPQEGWLTYDAATARQLIFTGGAWGYPPVPAEASFVKLGVNTTADATNRLAVRSNAVLLTDVDAADGGTGDVRIVANKETAGDTASFVFQTGFSGRAEVGLGGDDDFVFKVSPDGSAWTEAIRIDKDTGLPAIRYDNATSGLAATNVQDALDELAASGGGGGGSVASVFGRTGAVVAVAGDYAAGEVDNDSGVSGTTVKDALDALNTGLSGKQAADSDLTALAGLSTTGLIARTSSGAAATRTLTGTSNEVSVANGDGVSGNPTLSLPSTLALRAKTVQVQDNNFTIADDGDSTKLLAFQASAIASATTRTLTAQNASGTIALLDVENQAITGGGEVTSKDLGTVSSGTNTLDVADCPLQHYANNGAHTLAPGTPKGVSMIDITNGASAGAITTSGWTKVAGDAFTTTNGHKFRCHCSVGNCGSLLIVQALQ